MYTKYSRRSKAAAGAAIALLAGATSPVEPPVAADGAQRAESSAEIQDVDFAAWAQSACDVLGVRSVQLQPISFALDDGDVLFEVDIKHEHFAIRLWPHSTRSPGFRLFVGEADGSAREAALPPPNTYRGVVEGRSDWIVSASLIDGGVHAMIHRPGGSAYIQPIADLVAGAGSDVHAVYTADDVLPQPGVCGVTEEFLAQSLHVDAGDEGGQPIVDRDGEDGRALLAWQVDWEYYDLMNGDLAAISNDVDMIINHVNVIYANQVHIVHDQSTGWIWNIEGYPYPLYLTSPSLRLCAFRDLMNGPTPPAQIPRDVAHLFTGADLDGSTVGIAWLGVLCNSWIFACGNPLPGNGAYGMSQTRAFPSLAHRVCLTAHELGHNWNACHCNESDCTGGGADSDCGIMWSAVTGSDTFGSRSRSAIIAHRNSRDCLEPFRMNIYVDRRNSGAEDGSPEHPFNTVREGHDAVFDGGGVLRIRSGSYDESLVLNKTISVRTYDGTVVIGQ